jgi:hypothetical protein
MRGLVLGPARRLAQLNGNQDGRRPRAGTQPELPPQR